MAEVNAKKMPSIEVAIKKFKQKCQESGVISEMRRRKFYEKPSVRKKKKSEAARKRVNKKNRYRK